MPEPALYQTSMPLQAILAQLPTLDPAEMAELRQRVLALSAIDGVEDEDDWLLKGILNVLEERGLGETVPFRFKITNRRQFQGYLGKAEKVRNAVLSSMINSSKLDRLALGRLLARCLAERIEGFRTVTLNAMLQHVDQALPALEDCFPGYRRAGMLKILLRGVERA